MVTQVAVPAAAADTRAAVLVVGPLPPPYHGGSVATAYVLGSDLRRYWRVLHLDTTDRRGLENVGHFDLTNVLLALRHTAALIRMLITQRPALVYLGLAQNTLAVLRDAAFVLPALLFRRRVVLHLHGGGFRDYYNAAGIPLQALIRFMLRRASRIIVLGESLRRTIIDLAGTERLAVLPNGTADLFAAAPTRRSRAGPVRVLFLGNLIRDKGVFDVIEAVAALRGEGLDVCLDVAGGVVHDAQYATLEAAMASLGAGAALHGVVDSMRKRALLEAADILALPSYYANEAHPYVVLEAMSAALPVIATRRAALKETVVDGETGLLVTERDVAALASAIRRLATDAQLRARLGAAGRRRYEERYSLDVWSTGLCAIVREALA